MTYRDLHIAEVTMHQVVAEAAQRARMRAMLQQAGVEPRGWTSRQLRSLAARLGHLRVALSRRLKRYGVSPALPLKRPLGGGQ